VARLYPIVEYCRRQIIDSRFAALRRRNSGLLDVSQIVTVSEQTLLFLERSKLVFTIDIVCVRLCASVRKLLSIEKLLPIGFLIDVSFRSFCDALTDLKRFISWLSGLAD